ncbi:MAG: protoporphyrinogen oxidase HemJ [Alphaproteobacteria bacterium]
MQEFLSINYEWLRAFHIISVIAWMAGMLYLPRLFVYHVDAEKGSDKSETFKLMERRLLRLIINPAMIAAWVFGGLMLWANPVLLKVPSIHVKLTGVLLMTLLHHAYVRWMKAFQKDENTHDAKFYRIANEIPTVLMIIIVIMAVAEPL